MYIHEYIEYTNKSYDRLNIICYDNDKGCVDDGITSKKRIKP